MGSSLQDARLCYNGSVYEQEELDEFVDRHLENIEAALKSKKEKEKVSTALRADVVKFKKDFEGVISTRITEVIEETFSEYVRQCPIRKRLLSHENTRASAENAFLQDLAFSKHFAPLYLEILDNALTKFNEGLATDFSEKMIEEKDSPNPFDPSKSKGISLPIFQRSFQKCKPSSPTNKVVTFQEKIDKIDSDIESMFGPSVYV